MKLNRIHFIILVVLMATIVSACTIKNDMYRNDYDSLTLYNIVSNSFYTEGGVNVMDNDVLLEFIDIKPEYLIDYTVVKAKDAKNINEIGIFRVNSDGVNEIKDMVNNYVANLMQSYRAMDYFPEEIEKIDCAKVKVFGNYVIYSFLNEKDSESFYNSIEAAIRK